MWGNALNGNTGVLESALTSTHQALPRTTDPISPILYPLKRGRVPFLVFINWCNKILSRRKWWRMKMKEAEINRKPERLMVEEMILLSVWKCSWKSFGVWENMWCRRGKICFNSFFFLKNYIFKSSLIIFRYIHKHWNFFLINAEY